MKISTLLFFLLLASVLPAWLYSRSWGYGAGSRLLKRKHRGIIFHASVIGLGIVLTSVTASAGIIQVKSKVTDVNSTFNYLNVDRLNPQTHKTEEIKIDVERGTHFQGFESLRDLKIGDPVSIEADYNAFTHEWKALSIGPYN